MVQIPRASPRVQLTTQTTANRIGDISSFTQTSKAIQRAAATLESKFEEFKQLENLRQSSQALIEGGRRLTEAEDVLLNDPNLTESSARVFHQQKTDIIADVLSRVGDEATRLRLGVQLEGSAVIKGFNLKDNGRKADVIKYGVEKQEVQNQSLQDAFKTDVKGRQMLRESYKVFLNDNLKLSNPKAIAKDLSDYDEALRKGRARFWLEALTATGEGRDEQSRVDGAKLFIQQVSEGEYEELEIGEEEKLINEAENFIKRGEFRVKRELEAKQEVRQGEDLEDVIDFKFSPTQIAEKSLRKEWSPEFVKLAEKYIASVANINTTPKAFNEIFDMIDGIIDNPKTKKPFTRKELTEIMLDRATQDLGLPEFKTLKARLATRLSPQDKRRIDIGVKNIRAFARQKIAPSKFIGTLTEGEKSQVDQVEAFYKQTILNEEAVGVKIEDLVEETKALFSNVSPSVTVDSVLNAVIGQDITTKFGQKYLKTGRNKWELQDEGQ